MRRVLNAFGVMALLMTTSGVFTARAEENAPLPPWITPCKIGKGPVFGRADDRALDEIVRFLHTNERGWVLKIYGCTSRSGSARANATLTLLRANVAVQHLIDLGWIERNEVGTNVIPVTLQDDLKPQVIFELVSRERYEAERAAEKALPPGATSSGEARVLQVVNGTVQYSSADSTALAPGIAAANRGEATIGVTADEGPAEQVLEKMRQGHLNPDINVPVSPPVPVPPNEGEARVIVTVTRKPKVDTGGVLPPPPSFPGTGAANDTTLIEPARSVGADSASVNPPVAERAKSPVVPPTGSESTGPAPAPVAPPTSTGPTGSVTAPSAPPPGASSGAPRDSIPERTETRGVTPESAPAAPPAGAPPTTAARPTERKRSPRDLPGGRPWVERGFGRGSDIKFTVGTSFQFRPTGWYQRSWDKHADKAVGFQTVDAGLRIGSFVAVCRVQVSGATDELPRFAELTLGRAFQNVCISATYQHLKSRVSFSSAARPDLEAFPSEESKGVGIDVRVNPFERSTYDWLQGLGFGGAAGLVDRKTIVPKRPLGNGFEYERLKKTNDPEGRLYLFYEYRFPLN